MNYKRDDYNCMASLRRSALVQIAQKLGKDHRITQLMGCMSYGRNEAEQGPEGNLQSAVREMAFLDGCFHILHCVARANDDIKAQRVMCDLYPRGFASRK